MADRANRVAASFGYTSGVYFEKKMWGDCAGVEKGMGSRLVSMKELDEPSEITGNNYGMREGQRQSKMKRLHIDRS